MIQNADKLRFNVKPNASTNTSGVCKHSAIEHLGFNNNVAFLRCRDCAHVLVLQGGKRWAIPPPQGES
jgi:hypothetical protein